MSNRRKPIKRSGFKIPSDNPPPPMGAMPGSSMPSTAINDIKTPINWALPVDLQYSRSDGPPGWDFNPAHQSGFPQIPWVKNCYEPPGWREPLNAYSSNIGSFPPAYNYESFPPPPPNNNNDGDFPPPPKNNDFNERMFDSGNGGGGGGKGKKKKSRFNIPQGYKK